MKKTALRIRLAYSLPAFALAVIGIPVYVYIPKFYTDVVGVDVGAVGVLLFSVRLFDAITDPLVGTLSDRTRSRYGRRRPFIFGGSILIAVALVFLFNPPAAASPWNTLWFGFWIYALFLFWTLVAVPYESLGPEITYDYNARTALFAWRDGFLIAGTLAAAASPALVHAVFQTGDGPAGERSTFFWISAVYAPLVVALCAWCAWGVRERDQAPSPAQSATWRDFRTIFENRPFMILLAAYTISAIGSNLPATLILFYVQYVLESSQANLFLLLYFTTGILLLPVWVRLARRFGRKETWVASMAVNTGAFLGVFFLGPGDTALYSLLVVVSGIGFGATLALPSAIQADVIDYDELKTGRRREGQYIGLWSVAKKLAAAAGVGVGLAVLGAVGYTPNAQQSESVRLALRILYALVPSVCNLLAIVIALYYPISGDIHARIRSAIRRRESGLSVADPLKPARNTG
ncbi:MFS transporter [Desulfosarcina alkanivorans]|uniref:MFS transporter n=1 Tax=Desulfosarcina alkanivorans TaxID=571177 RepID=A0A5K7YVH9_9BACT|nr:MFS transporter [Desulfosarcina alkanivorans]BBO72039.1 MFS transporter [Desulfosarcina alkanivorans]